MQFAGEVGSVSILIVNAGDFRHLLKSLAHIPYTGKLSNVNIYVSERSPEALARLLLHLRMSENTELSAMERAEIILDSYGNLNITENTL